MPRQLDLPVEAGIKCQIAQLKETKVGSLKIQYWENGILLRTQKINFEFTANSRHCLFCGVWRGPETL